MENDPNTPQNDQTPQSPVVLPSANFQDPQESKGPLDKVKSGLHQPKLTAAIALGLVLLVVGGVMLSKKDEQVNNLGGNNSAVVFKDWLKPAGEIKVGDNRYVSTCQVLPVSTVIDTMYDGKPPATFAVSEDYYDGSPVEKKYSRPTTSCTYGDTVSLKAEQYFNAADTKRLSYTVSTSGDNYVQDKVNAYKRAAESSSDTGLKDFVGTIETSAKTFLEKKDVSSSKATENLDTSTLIIPTGNNAVEFTLFSNNILYELAIPSKVAASKVAEAPSDQLLTQIQQAKELVDALRKNSQNTQLSQSPALTILSDSAKVGQTYVLEPCAILSREITKTITGLDQSNAIDRNSVIYGLNESRSSQSGVAILPSNDCTRTVRTSDDELSSAKTTIKLDIEYAPDAAALDKKIKDSGYAPKEPTNIQIQSNADLTVEYAVSGFKPFYQFRVGNYWAYLKITDFDPKGTQVQVSREKHIAAINLLVDSLKANLKEAESTQGR